MASNEKTTSDVPKTPIAAPTKAETPSKALPVQEKQGEKPTVKPGETQKAPEKKDIKPSKTDIEIKKETIGTDKIELQKRRNAAKEIQDGTKVYSEELYSLESMDGPGLVPPRPDQKMVKAKDYERSQKELHEQENETAKAIEGKMNAELESVTKNGNLDQLAPEPQKKIRNEVVRTSIDPQLLPDEKKKEILSTMQGADGKPMFDMSLVDLKNLTPSQKEYIIQSDTVKNMASGAVEEYKKISEEAQKNGKKPDPELIKKLQSQFGLPSTESLELSQIRSGMKSIDFPANTQIGIVKRILAESTFNELRDTLVDGMKWSHVPEVIKREIIKNTFSAESDKNTPDIQQAIIESKAMAASPDYAKEEGESPAQFDARFKEKTGVAASNLEVLALEARKSGLSPGMRALADFFGPIGAALGMPFWKEFMGQNSGRDDTADTSDRYMTKDGNNNYTEKSGEVAGTQSPELAKNGFKGDVMNSIWRWEYQAGHNVEVVPAGKSGLTLCGGIDLAYTPYNKVQNIFKGILKEETIAKLQPFCENGRQGPIRGQAENLLRAKAGLKEEINGQLNYQNMGEAFTRSLAIDWERLVNKYGSVVKNAPGYIQVFMLSRFYHAGIGGSSRIIQQVIASGFKHDSVISIAESFRNTRSESYYRNRMGQEIAYLRSRPGDAVPPVANAAQDGKGAELSQNQSPVQWFEKNAKKPYGSGEGQYDCMTSTHAALGLNYTKDYAGAFNGKFIDKKDKNNNLWNVAMASALYVGNISSANSEAKDGIIKKQPNGYYGEKSQDVANMEYYIEENVMKRVNDSSDGKVDVGNSGKLIHYSKSKKGVQGIMDDIKNRLKPGESAMMGATGEGTNKKGHEWLVYNNNGVLKAYDATNAGGQGVSGTGMELSSFLNDSRRAQYTNEAIIFAKKPGVVPAPQNLAKADSSSKVEQVFGGDIFGSRSSRTSGDTAFITDSHGGFLKPGTGLEYNYKTHKAFGQNPSSIPTILSGGRMTPGDQLGLDKDLSLYNRMDSEESTLYLKNRKNIVIILGTNDANSTNAQGMMANMKNIIDKINTIKKEEKDYKILVVTPPINRSPNVNAKIAEYEEMLLAREGSLGIKVAPFYTYSQEQKLGLSDADHLNTAGYQAMKRYINTYI